MPPVHPHSILVRNDGELAWRRYPDLGTLVVHLRSRRELLLRGTGEFLWELCETPVTAAEACRRVAAEYRIDDRRATTDVHAFLEKACEQGLVGLDAERTAPPAHRTVHLIDADPQARAYFHDRSIPCFAQVVVTHRCNYRCVHCYLPEFAATGLTAPALSHALGDLARLGGLYVRFSGGEPLLRRDIFDVLEAATALHFAWTLNTNGHLVDDATAGRLARLRPFEVCVSLYGATRAAHEAVTGTRGSFNRCLAAVSALRGHGIPVRANFVVMCHNLADVDAARALADERGAAFNANYVVFPRSDGAAHPLQSRLRTRQLRQLAGSRAVPPPRPAFCSPARCKMSIGPEGDVFPCELIPIALGHLSQKTLFEIWTRDADESPFRKGTIPLPGACHACGLRDRCFRCPGISLLEHGSLEARSTFLCQAAHCFAAVQDVLSEAPAPRGDGAGKNGIPVNDLPRRSVAS